MSIIEMIGHITWQVDGKQSFIRLLARLLASALCPWYDVVLCSTVQYFERRRPQRPTSSKPVHLPHSSCPVCYADCAVANEGKHDTVSRKDKHPRRIQALVLSLANLSCGGWLKTRGRGMDHWRTKICLEVALIELFWNEKRTSFSQYCMW